MTQTKKILVAEDEPDIRGLIKFSLEFVGLEVVEAADGLDAVEKALQELPDLILLDVRMPKLDGYEACEQLKEHESTQNIPVAFLSARGQEEEVKHGLELGAAEYILKPFAPDQLQKRVLSMIENVGK